MFVHSGDQTSDCSFIKQLFLSSSLVSTVRRGREDLLQEHPQQHQVQHQAVREENPRGGGQDGVSPAHHTG